MATDILIKRSSTPGAVPTTGDLSTGELAINTADKRLFTNNSGTIVEIGIAPTSIDVTNNATVGGTLDVTGNTTLSGTLSAGATTLASGSVSGNFEVTGTLTVATPSNSTDAASKGYVDTAVANVIDSAPGALDTLNELAAAINDDANFATTVTNALAGKLALSGGTMTGDITMGANAVTSTATPATADTLTRKGYVDSILGSATSAATSATAAASSASDAADSASAASTSASNASTSETNAATSASNASTSETNAASSATAASNSATSASNSATASANSASAAATSATNAENAYDSFDDRYLGAKASDPSVDNDGDALITGALYFNTGNNTMRVYNGSAWEDVVDAVINLADDTTPQLGGNLDTNGNDITFGDNDKAIFGAGSDLQIYHDGSNSYIAEVGAGNLRVQGTNNVYLQVSSDGGTTWESAVLCDADGAVTLRHNNFNKLATTSTGIDVTGTAVTDGLTVSGNVSVDGGTIKLDGNYPVSTDNVALGDTALDSLTTGISNVAIGSAALTANTTGNDNSAFGYNALGSVTTGASNSAFGSYAGDALTTGGTNTAVGVVALSSETTGSDNTALGAAALLTQDGAQHNTGLGREALRLTTTGSYNVAVGSAALRSNTTASYNTAVGYQAGYTNTTGQVNTAIGYQALYSNTTASDNDAHGYRALYSNTTGTFNVGMGGQTLYDNTTGNNNTALGYSALANNTTASNNTAVGYQALNANTTGTSNVAVGTNALDANTTGSGNVAVGYQALTNADQSNGSNEAIGQNALKDVTTGYQNTAVGRESGSNLTSGTANISMGYQSLNNVTTGSGNTAIGRLALRDANSSTAQNTAVGYLSGYLMTTGQKNTIIGAYSGNQGGLDIRTSSNNIVLSDGDGNPRLWINSSGQIFNGQATANSLGVSGDLLSDGIGGVTIGDQFVIASRFNDASGYFKRENSNGPVVVFYKDGASVGNIFVTGSSTAYNTSSDYRLKENVTDITDGIDRLKQLPVHKFNFISDPDKTVDGFLAHEAQAVVPEAVTGTKDEVDDEGNPVMQGIDQSKLVPLLTAALKEAITEIESLKARVETLENA